MSNQPASALSSPRFCNTGTFMRIPHMTEPKDWDFAIDRIARHLKEERDAGFVKKNAKGQTVNRVESVAHLGSSNVDSEECWSMAVFARSYGLVYIDHQARV